MEITLGYGERHEVAPGVWLVNAGRPRRRRRRARDGCWATRGPAVRIGIEAPRSATAVRAEKWGEADHATRS